MNKLNGQNLNAEIFNLKTGDICIYRANKINIYFTYYIFHFYITIKELLPFQSRFGSFKEEKNF